MNAIVGLNYKQINKLQNIPVQRTQIGLSDINASHLESITDQITIPIMEMLSYKSLIPVPF